MLLKYLPAGTKLLPVELKFSEQVHYWQPQQIHNLPDVINESCRTYYLLINELKLPSVLQVDVIASIPEQYHSILKIACLLHDIQDLSAEISLSDEEWDLIKIVISKNLEQLPAIFDPKIVLQLIRVLAYLELENSQSYNQTKYSEDLLSAQTNVGPINFYKVGDNGSLKTTSDLNLVQVPHSESIDKLPTDEWDDSVYSLMTKCNKLELRRLILKEFRQQIDLICSPVIQSAQQIIEWWYQQPVENKLSRESIDDLIYYLNKYPRPEDWPEEQIRMKINQLVIPTYSIKSFISEYDSSYLNERIDRTQKCFQRFLALINEFQPISEITELDSWDKLIESLIEETAFKIPILSLQGLTRALNFCPKSFQLFRLVSYGSAYPDGLYNSETNHIALFMDTELVNNWSCLMI